VCVCACVCVCICLKRESEREREVLLTIKKSLKVGKHTALSGNTASGRTSPAYGRQVQYPHSPVGRVARLRLREEGAMRTISPSQSPSRSFDTNSLLLLSLGATNSLLLSVLPNHLAAPSRWRAPWDVPRGTCLRSTNSLLLLSLGATNSLFLGCGCAIYVKFFFHGLDLRRLFFQINLFLFKKKIFHRLNLRDWLPIFEISGLGIRDYG